MSVGNYPQGPFILVCGSDGTKPIVVKTDADGHPQVDVLTLGGAGALALEATLQEVRDRIGALTTPAAGSSNYLLDLIADRLGTVGGGDAGTALAYLLEAMTRLGDETSPAAGTLAKLLTDALTALQLIDDLRNALGSVNTDDLQVDVKTSALPTGAATQTTLADILAKLDVALSTRALESGGNLAAAVTALQTIDDFALGTNKLIGYNGLVTGHVDEDNATAGTNTLSGAVCPAGEIWFIQAQAARNRNTNPTTIWFYVNNGVDNWPIYQINAPGINFIATILQTMTIAPGGYCQCIISGCAAGDDIDLWYWGYKMKIS